LKRSFGRSTNYQSLGDGSGEGLLRVVGVHDARGSHMAKASSGALCKFFDHFCDRWHKAIEDDQCFLFRSSFSNHF
jgi:hypothetical protein